MRTLTAVLSMTTSPMPSRLPGFPASRFLRLPHTPISWRGPCAHNLQDPVSPRQVSWDGSLAGPELAARDAVSSVLVKWDLRTPQRAFGCTQGASSSRSYRRCGEFGAEHDDHFGNLGMPFYVSATGRRIRRLTGGILTNTHSSELASPAVIGKAASLGSAARAVCAASFRFTSTSFHRVLQAHVEASHIPPELLPCLPRQQSLLQPWEDSARKWPKPQWTWREQSAKPRRRPSASASWAATTSMRIATEQGEVDRGIADNRHTQERRAVSRAAGDGLLARCVQGCLCCGGGVYQCSDLRRRVHVRPRDVCRVE
ncbi:hypothetical protein BD309DRAFT_608651 [Dichomitus squalens]|nr:hypothetical protein BD309DRAFT_608651 [Dichomitus squalens]